ncbi:MAG TPA: glycosyltransferase [Candidatus Sulfotelmatobacter sp.]|nr:glycosyltransferase [Candidatus Sulfotelmatobacter sp.]
MLKIAYLANTFPSDVEPYVSDEIRELKRRGVIVVTGSVRAPKLGVVSNVGPEIIVQLHRISIISAALWLCVTRFRRLAPLLFRVLFCGRESLLQRLKAIAHTSLGACYAAQLREHAVDHIHVHHGYFGSWIAMVAARLLDVGFSLTLHGSDLLLHATYLDVKLAECSFCMTVSEYNRRFILEHYPSVDQEKIVVTRMGVDLPRDLPLKPKSHGMDPSCLNILSVGRLHAVKDHAFLVHACAHLAASGVRFECSIAGDGPERASLESLIRQLGVAHNLHLLGHVPREQIGSLYDHADIVLLTSRSEGIPLVLMEAMARAKIVLAPAITGIPELVIPGKTGFLYEPGSMHDFVQCLLFIHSVLIHETEGKWAGPGKPDLFRWIRHAARTQIQHNFNRSKNLDAFANCFVNRIVSVREMSANENLVLQQI